MYARMRTRRLTCGWAAAVAAMALAVTPAPAGPAPEEKKDDGLNVHWQKGPGKAAIGDRAEIVLPKGYRFTGGDDTRTILKLMGNLTGDNELGLLAPTKGLDWFMVFEFDDVGYVKDDDKNDLDADAMLARLREGNVAGNQERAKHKMPPLTLVGWAQKPKYDTVTNNLEWATKLECQGQTVVNYHTRRLGRQGVMRVSLVVEPDKMDATLPTFHKLLTGFSYTSGHRYAEFKSGDKIAAYGLAALVAGGGAAAALKFGLLQKFWKLIVVAVVAVLGGIKKIFGRRSTSSGT